INDQPVRLLSATGKNHDYLEQRFFDVHELIGKEAYLELVDEETSAGGHITVDDIRLADDRPPTEPKVNELVAQAVGPGKAQNPDMLAGVFVSAVRDCLGKAKASGALSDGEKSWLAWAMRDDVPLAAMAGSVKSAMSVAEQSQLDDLLTRREKLESDF